jgi:hypothetical protein
MDDDAALEDIDSKGNRFDRFVLKWRSVAAAGLLAGFSGFAVAVALLAVFMFMLGKTDLSDSSAPQPIGARMLEATASPIAIATIESPVDPEVDLTRRTDERLLQAVYFTIGTVLATAGIIGAFGWFSSTRLREIELATIETKIQSLRLEAQTHKEEMGRLFEIRFARQESRERLALMRDAIARQDVKEAIREAANVADSLIQAPPKQVAVEKRMFNDRLEYLCVDIASGIESDPVTAARLYKTDLGALVAALKDLADEHVDDFLQRRCYDELKEYIEALPIDFDQDEYDPSGTAGTT